MTHSAHRIACVALLILTASAKNQSRWSRQISTYTADISDWVPLPGPVERESDAKKQASAEARVLSEPVIRPTGFGSETFPSRTFYNSPANKQLYLQSVPSVPSAPQNYLTDQGFGQGVRFGLTQPNFPLSQGFVSPQFAFDSPQVPQIQPRPQAIPTTPVKFENYPKQGPVAQNAYINPPPRKETPKYVDGYRVENTSNDFSYNVNKKPQSLQKIKYDSFEKTPKLESTQGLPKVEREEVQLLYVPVESLNRGQFNFRSPLTTSQIVNTDIYSQGLPRPASLKQATEFRPQNTKPVVDTFGDQDYFSRFNTQLKQNYNAQVKESDQIPKYSTIASPFPTYQTAPITEKPKKLKPHQPPLAIFLTKDESNNQIKVGDVLSSLKTANTIAVLDSVNPSRAPKVFIGPSTLTPPEKYVKFELPYLSNIENSDKKLRQLPFFVAPLSYNTPQGFAKIPFPSPHVGSVVINSQIKDPQSPVNTAKTVPNLGSSVVPNIVQNTIYNSEPNTANIRQSAYRQEETPVNQRPNYNYFTTSAPKASSPNYHSKYYSVEPQSVSSVRQNEPERVTTSKTGSYFLTNVGSQHNPTQYVNFQSNYKSEPSYTTRQTTTTTTTQRTTSTRQRLSTTTAKPSTFASPLLETHNPYSINQAFHFSTPLDYHNYFDEYKEAQGNSEEVNSSSTTAAPVPRVEEVTEKKYQQSSPNYLQNYSPEIHYESEDQNSRFSAYNDLKYSGKPETTTLINDLVKTEKVDATSDTKQTEYYGDNTDAQFPISEESPTDPLNQPPSSPDIVPPPNYEYNQYETSYNEEDISPITTTTTTTTTTTRRTPVRSRGRPRYTTAKYDSNEQPTRATSTRRPLRERRPVTSRPKYEQNRITTEKSSTEKPTRKPVEPTETTTQYYTRSRTRGRVHYKTTKNEDNSENRNRYNTKEQDLAYQRDVLHQNYPVTLTEQGSTVNLEAVTESIPKISSTKGFEIGTETFDTENAYTNERLSISQQNNEDEKDDIPVFTRTSQTENPYQPRQTTRGQNYYYQSRSSLPPVETAVSYEEPITEREEPKQTSLSHNYESDVNTYITETPVPATESNLFSQSASDEYETQKEDTTESLDIEIKSNKQEKEIENEEEENVVETTPSYNRIRVRPGVVRQYQQATTETSRRRKPVQAVTYRPAFDRRRTTMRIDEIEADLKTKQVHSRSEVQDYKHPVYKPEPTTEPIVTSTQESTTKRNFRRRRPSYTHSASSTESSASTRKSFEAKNRFRGRRPTEKPTVKPELQTDTQTTTARSSAYNRYSHRPRLSERFNKKQVTEKVEDSEDQDSNYSINRPTYVQPDEQWSTKISGDSFKPFNPNEIVEDKKTTVADNSNQNSDMDIITARNEYEDILISVTPASNKPSKKLAEIPPTLEAFVEQSKVTNSDSTDSMSTFESMLEEVMKSLEEQDQDEYTKNVMKHKGGEIGEIPPERIISSGDNYAKTTSTVDQVETTTLEPMVEDSATSDEDDYDRKTRRRGFWKKVKVHPAVTDSIEFAESQYYTNTVNRLGQPITNNKISHEKVDKAQKSKLKITTYKPSYQFIQELFNDDDNIPLEDVLPTMDLSKIKKEDTTKKSDDKTAITENVYAKHTNPGDLDLGTGTPDPTFNDFYYTSTAATVNDRSDGFSLMEYLFGTSDEKHDDKKLNDTSTSEDIVITTEQPKSKVVTTEGEYIPDEITAASEINTEIAEISDVKRIEEYKELSNSEEDKRIKIETSSVSSFMDPTNILSTSVSTQVSHETEICFRGKCIKTNKTIL